MRYETNKTCTALKRKEKKRKYHRYSNHYLYEMKEQPVKITAFRRFAYPTSRKSRAETGTSETLKSNRRSLLHGLSSVETSSYSPTHLLKRISADRRETQRWRESREASKMSRNETLVRWKREGVTAEAQVFNDTYSLSLLSRRLPPLGWNPCASHVAAESQLFPINTYNWFFTARSLILRKVSQLKSFVLYSVSWQTHRNQTCE